MSEFRTPYSREEVASLAEGLAGELEALRRKLHNHAGESLSTMLTRVEQEVPRTQLRTMRNLTTQAWDDVENSLQRAIAALERVPVAYRNAITPERW